MGTPINLRGRQGDLIIAEFHPSYNRVSAFVIGATGVAVDILDLMGYPVKASGANYQLALAGDEASVVGLIVGPYRELILAASPAVAAFPVDIVVRGPIVYDPANLPTQDANPTPGTFNLTTLQTTLKNLNFIALSEPTISLTQTS